MLYAPSPLTAVNVRGLDTVLRRFTERVPAGFPSAAEGYEDDPLNLHDLAVQHPASTFYFRVEGDDLLDEHVTDGSILVVDRCIVAAVGRLVVIEEDGHFVITRMRRGRMVVVFGVVVACLSKF